MRLDVEVRELKRNLSMNSSAAYGPKPPRRSVELIYSHFYDKLPARCSADNTSRQLAAKHLCREYSHCGQARLRWRRARVENEVLLHLLHSFGVIGWVQ